MLLFINFLVSIYVYAVETLKKTTTHVQDMSGHPLPWNDVTYSFNQCPMKAVYRGARSFNCLLLTGMFYLRTVV